MTRHLPWRHRLGLAWSVYYVGGVVMGWRAIELIHGEISWTYWLTPRDAGVAGAWMVVLMGLCSWVGTKSAWLDRNWWLSWMLTSASLLLPVRFARMEGLAGVAVLCSVAAGIAFGYPSVLLLGTSGFTQWRSAVLGRTGYFVAIPGLIFTLGIVVTTFSDQTSRLDSPIVNPLAMVLTLPVGIASPFPLFLLGWLGLIQGSIEEVERRGRVKRARVCPSPQV